MNRRDRRAIDPAINTKRERFDKARLKSGNTSVASSGGGWGVGSPGARPASGTAPAVNPFMLPKAAGLTVTSQTFPSNYYVEWNLSTWRSACDQVIKQGYTVSYSTLVNWVYESSPFVRSLFRAIGSAIGKVPIIYVNHQGEELPEWTLELCSKPWQKQLKKEFAFSFFWGFIGLNIDPVAGKLYKYPMQDIDPINRMLRSSTFSFYDGVNFDEYANLLFIQPSTSTEDFLGWMQPITRSFIQMNVNSNSWVAAGRRLAFPLMTVGYPQGDGAVNPFTGNEVNPYRLQAENIVANADPGKGLVYPYTIDGQGNIVKALQVEFEKTGTTSSAHKIFSDFNNDQKDEIREMILGGTLTSSVGDSGSRALGEVQQDKLDNVVEDLLDFVISCHNDQYLTKIQSFYSNFPAGQFKLNVTRHLKLEQIKLLSDILRNNNKRLTDAFFEAQGLIKDFYEDDGTGTNSADETNLFAIDTQERYAGELKKKFLSV